MRKINDLLQEAKAAGASDIHISAGRYPLFRIDGQLKPIGQQQLKKPEADSLIGELLVKNAAANARLAEHKQVDLSYELPDRTRFRVHIFKTGGGTAAALRLVPRKIRSLEELSLPPSLARFAELKQGFVLIVGPAGHGKSTTMAALIDHINQHRPEHIITIEDPIEYLFTDSQSAIDQREIGRDAGSFAQAIRATLRQDPNVIMIGELRDLDSMQTAITVAETGHLVFATLHTNDAAQTVERLIDSFPATQQQQVRSQLSAALSGVISLRLVPKQGGGRLPAAEIMIANPAIRNIIREGNTHQIPGVIQTNADEGMQTLDASLKALVQAGSVSAEHVQPYLSISEQVPAAV